MSDSLAGPDRTNADPLLHPEQRPAAEVEPKALMSVRGKSARRATGRVLVTRVISMALMKICVTGSSGRAGRAVVGDLTEHGYRVIGTDVVPLAGDDQPADFLRADLTDYGQVVEVLSGVDAVVHLANIPAPGLRTPSETFNQNMTMNFN